MENSQILHQLNACAAICNICYEACLNEEDIAMLSRSIELTRDCADLCQLSAAALTRDSEFVDSILKLCADVCETCAMECEKHEHEHCQRCAGVCRKCAEMCNEHQQVS